MCFFKGLTVFICSLYLVVKQKHAENVERVEKDQDFLQFLILASFNNDKTFLITIAFYGLFFFLGVALIKIILVAKTEQQKDINNRLCS